MENLELHECDVTCNKLLNCGLHRYVFWRYMKSFLIGVSCERKDHKGLCPPCLQSSFDEVDGVLNVILTIY
jgi:transcriptional repressor NF-X1